MDAKTMGETICTRASSIVGNEGCSWGTKCLMKVLNYCFKMSYTCSTACTKVTQLLP